MASFNFLINGHSLAEGQFVNIGGVAAKHGLIAPYCNRGFEEGRVVYDDVEPVFFAKCFSTNVLLVVGMGFVEQVLGMYVECFQNLLPTGASGGGLQEGIGTDEGRQALGMCHGFAVVA